MRAGAAIGAEDRGACGEAGFIVDIDGFAGPLGLLLDLARREKVDLKQISIVHLADQYLAFIAAAGRANLPLAAEYLVMAAWVAYLKSRLLLPQPLADEPDPADLAAALAHHLRRLDAVRRAASQLMARPQLGEAFFLRPPRPLTQASPPSPAVPPVPPVPPDLGVADLLRAVAAVAARHRRRHPLRMPPLPLARLEDAVARLRAGLGHAPDWETLSRYLPEGTVDGVRLGDLRARSEVAVTVMAALELARIGLIALRQGRAFGPILIRYRQRQD